MSATRPLASMRWPFRTREATCRATGLRRPSVVAVGLVCALPLSARAAPGPARLADVAPLLERFSGHLAILPGTSDGASRAFPLVHWLRRAGLADHLFLLSGRQLLDPDCFNAKQFPVAVYASGEPYRQTVQEQGDGDEALLRYLGEGGALLVLSSGPLPFWYNERSQAARSLPRFGLPIAGAGVSPWPAHLAGVRASSEGPPKGRTLTFHTHADQQIVTGLPSTFRYPASDEADQRWRGIVSAPPPGSRYTPVVSLRDDAGGKYGEGVAVIEHDSGRFAGARMAYVWCSLLAVSRTREPILAGLFRYALSGVEPPPATIGAPLTAAAPKIDGKLTEPCWDLAARTRRFLPSSTEGTGQIPLTIARLAWTRKHLLIGVECHNLSDTSGEDALLLGWRPGEQADWRTVELRLGKPTANLPVDAAFASATAEGVWRAEISVPLAAFGVVDARFGSRLQLQLARRCASLPSPLLWSPAEQFGEGTPGALILAPDPHGDDFELHPEGSDGTPHWRIGSGKWRVEDGTLVGENTGDDGFLTQGAAYGDDSWRNYELALRFKVDSYADNWRDGPRIGFRCNADGDGYHVNFNDRNIQVHKSILGVSTNERTALATAPWKRDTKWHSLKIRAVVNTFAFELDGKPLFSFRDDMLLDVPSHRTGGMTLGSRRWSKAKGTMRVRYDDVRMTPLPAPKRWSFE